MPNLPLTGPELRALMATYKGPGDHWVKEFDIRDRAITRLIIDAEMKMTQIVKLERHHYQRGAESVTVPATRYQPERVARVDAITRRMLDDWLNVRDDIIGSRVAPFFCTTLADVRGGEIPDGQYRKSLARHAAKAGIEKAVRPEGLRKSKAYQREISGGGVEGRIRAYIDEDSFAVRYPQTYDRWRIAQDLYEADAVRHATRIGHDVREAMLHFAEELSERHGVQFAGPATQTANRIRAVLEYRRDLVGETTTKFLDALVTYWRNVSDLAQRQEHGASREAEALTEDDARRLIFQALVVMYEVDTALRRVEGHSPTA